jgi:hypothetical protein
VRTGCASWCHCHVPCVCAKACVWNAATLLCAYAHTNIRHNGRLLLLY